MKYIVRVVLFATTLGATQAMGEIRDIKLTLQRVQFEKPYDQVIAEFERLIPALDVDRLETLVDSNANADQITAAVEEMTGSQPLVRFHRIRSGDLFTVLGESRVESIKYIVGNAFIARQLFIRDLTAGLYVPFAINIYGQDEKTFLEFLQPSSFIVHISSDAGANEIGRQLDEIMNKLVRELEGH
jgi:hypothetical protein